MWTNRFPVSYLEGFEDLIQDPHKMLDEINGRRFMVRSYLDTGEPLQCRDPERCVHCFVEPLCTTMDRTIAAQNADAWDVWWIGEPRPVDSLPFGCGRVGIRADALDELAVARPDGAGLYVELDSVEPLAGLPAGPITLVATAAEPLRAWLSQPLAESVSLEIRLNRDTAGVVAERAEDLAALGDRVLVHQPGFETLAAAADSDVRDPRAFFGGLEAPLRVSGLPACLIPGMRWAEEPRILDAALFDADTGRLSIRALARDHVTRSYRAKSLRCRECALDDRCDGEHINRLRDQGLSVLTPLSEIPDGHPGPRLRLATGAAPQPPAPSLPGFERPTAATTDPLAEYARIRADRLAARARRAADRDG